MYMYTPGHCRSISTGIYLPEQRVTSKQLMEEIDIGRFDLDTDWMDEKMGICERRYAVTEMKPSELAINAANQALEKASISSDDIDLIIYCGIERDYLEPGTAHIVQDAIGASAAICFDVSNACHGFMNGIHLADALIATGQARRALITTGEKPSRVIPYIMDMLKKITSYKEFELAIGGLTVGDAGAAMVLGPKLGPESGFIGFMLDSKGKHHKQCVWGTGTDQTGHMEMRNIVYNFVQMHAKMYPNAMEKFGWQPQQIDQFVHHQVGKGPFRRHAAYSGVSKDLMSDTVSWLGNITTATIPVNLHLLDQSGTVKDGDRVFIAGTGSGLSVSQSGLIWEAA